MYRIAGNFRHGEIFAYFATKLKWWKNNQRKFCMFKLNPLVAIHYAHVFCEHCWGEMWLAAMALLHNITVLPGAKCRAIRSCWASFVIAPIDGDEQANVAITRSQVLRQWKRPTHWYMCLIATNESLSLHTRRLPPPQSVDHNIYKRLKSFLARVWVCVKINPAKI